MVAAGALLSGDEDVEGKILRAEKHEMWRATILTLFPEMFPGPLGLVACGRGAWRRELWACEPYDIRAHGIGRHRAIDDTPAGGGAGMVMRADVLAEAIDAATPAGRSTAPPLDDAAGPAARPGSGQEHWPRGPGVALLCGRFEGVDERVIAARNLEEVSIGDFVLSGGEIAALTVLDACIRLVPGIMGKPESGVEESFENGLLEYPHYTRPREFEGQADSPPSCSSGDHARIAAWRRAEAERILPSRDGRTCCVTKILTRRCSRLDADQRPFHDGD